MSYRSISCHLVGEWSNVRAQSIVGCYCPPFSMSWWLNIGNIYILARAKTMVYVWWAWWQACMHAHVRTLILIPYYLFFFHFLIDIGGKRLREETLSGLLCWSSGIPFVLRSQKSILEHWSDSNQIANA
jgi:uncharacterized membrane protein YhaH (DUF805 family)